MLLPFFWVIFVSFTNRTLLGKTALNPEFVGLGNYLHLFDPATFFQRGQFGFSLILTTQFVLLSALVGQALLGPAAGLADADHPACPEAHRRGLRDRRLDPARSGDRLRLVRLPRLRPRHAQLRSSPALGLPRGDFLLQQPFWVIVIFNTWRGAAFSMMLFNSAFSSIPPSYFQAADVAGASSWQKFRDIGLPLIRGHVVTDLILITMWTFNVFTPFLLTNGGPSYRTELLSIYNYRVAFKRLRVRQGRRGGRRSSC